MGGCCSKDEKFEGLVWIEEDYEDNVELREGDGGARVRLHGSCRFASMYTQPGSKGINQDAMTLWEVEVEALVIQGPRLATVINQVKKLEASVLVLA